MKREKGMGNRMRKATRTISLPVIALMLVTICVFAQLALAAQISVEPKCQIVSNGTSFTVNVNITVDPEDNKTYAAEYKLQFNNTLLNATSQVNGSFLSQDGVSTIEVVNELNNTLGKIEYCEMRTGVDNGTNISGVLAIITFEAIADGFCELGLYDVILSDDVGPPSYPIPTNITNGSVRVGLCGDATADENVWLNDGWQIYSNKTFPGQYPIHLWAADVTNDGNVWLNDGWQIYSNKTFPGQYPLNCRCCS